MILLWESNFDFFALEINCFRDCAQILLLILIELINFFSRCDYPKTYGGDP